MCYLGKRGKKRRNGTIFALEIQLVGLIRNKSAFSPWPQAGSGAKSNTGCRDAGRRPKSFRGDARVGEFEVQKAVVGSSLGNESISSSLSRPLILRLRPIEEHYLEGTRRSENVLRGARGCLVSSAPTLVHDT